MKRTETHTNQNMVSRALQSSVIALILITAIPIAAQQMNESRRGHEMSAQQQTPRRNPDLDSLNILVGTWKLSDPTGKKGGISGQITYEWMEGGFFLIQRFDFEHNGQRIKGIEVIGHEHPFGGEPGKEIKSRVYDNMGNTWYYVYEVDRDTLTIWGGQKGSPAFFKGKFSDDGNTCTGGWEYPGGGGYKATMTRIKK